MIIQVQDIKLVTGRVGSGKVSLLTEWLIKPLTEDIKLPVEVGDTILMGRFKNKKVVVKSIGKDEHGMPTINGKKVVTFRLMKEGFDVDLEDENTSLEESCARPMKGETEQQFRTRCFGINPLAQPPKGLMRVVED